MTDTIQSARPGAVDGPSRPPRRGMRIALAVGAVLVVVAAVLIWAGLGTLKAVPVVQERASVAASELAQFRGLMQAGDSAKAKQHLDAGAAAIAAAQAAADRPQVRIARYVPYVGRTVSDLDHLLAAASTLSGAAGDALTIYEQFSGADSKLFKNNTFDIAAIRSASKAATALAGALDSATRDLNQVTGTGPRGGQALEKKQAALEQVASLRSQLGGFAPLLAALPSAVGADGPKTYLITVLNPAESRAPGGAPLSVAFVRLDEGRLTIPVQGQTTVLTNGNQPRTFTPAKGDPWLIGRGERRFVNANVNPDFTIAGEQLLRASSSFRQAPVGVIALDVKAIGRLLQATGPIQSPEYGELNADNIAQKLVVDAYLAPQDQQARHERNDQLMQIMLARLTEGGGLIGKARALGEAVPGRHLQMYFRDPVLQKVVIDAKAGGQVASPPTGDLAAVYTQNINGSKVDTYQHRTVNETFTLAADGSATVRRTVVIENRTPPYAGDLADDKFGYYTRWAVLRVINLMPPGSSITAQPTTADSPGLKAGSAQHKGVDGAGRLYADAVTEIEPGGTAELTWQYRLPKAAVPDGDGLRLLVHAETQPLLNPPNLQVSVVAPKGWSAQVSPGWAKTATGATATATIDQARLLQLRVAPAR